jgi:hypothetical protein
MLVTSTVEVVILTALRCNVSTYIISFSRSRTIFRSSDFAVIRVGHLVSFTL